MPIASLRCPSCGVDRFLAVLGTVVLIMACSECDWTGHLVFHEHEADTLRALFTPQEAPAGARP